MPDLRRTYPNLIDVWKTAWITGASQGIGRALATRLAGLGVKTACTARSEIDLDNLCSGNKNLISMPLDVGDRTAADATFRAVEKELGHLDLAILNAGIYQPLPGGIASTELFEEHIRVNYLGVVNTLMPILDSMTARGHGQVAIMGSVAGYRGLPQSAAYGPTKAALINLAESLRVELDGTGVDLRLINPGFVATRLTDKNTFKMPSVMPPEAAAKEILKGLSSSKFEIIFPWGFVRIMKLLRLLPYPLYLRIASRLKAG